MPRVRNIAFWLQIITYYRYYETIFENRSGFVGTKLNTWIRILEEIITSFSSMPDDGLLKLQRRFMCGEEVQLWIVVIVAASLRHRFLKIAKN